MWLGHRRGKQSLVCIFMLYFGALIVSGLAPRSAAAADTEQVLYSFCATGGQHCTDGNNPEAGLLLDKSGNLYGTTESGGAYHYGAVFELTPNANKTAWAYKVLYSFCPKGPRSSCPDGLEPQAAPIMDASGNLYGTTPIGGAYNAGAVFELSPNASRTAWTQKVLYSFCPAGGDCPDGNGPNAGLIMDASGKLYGTTIGGGGKHLAGTVFELTPNSNWTAWTEKVLYSFCAKGGENCTDGRFPNAALIMDASGNLYSTTEGGGAHNGGVVFELTPNANKTAWTYKVLYSFCSTGGSNCTDGRAAFEGLIMDTSGNLYGTTAGGGAYLAESQGAGTVFELTPNANRTTWTEKVLYSFCAQGGENCTDGESPSSGLIMDKSGNLYGTTCCGGARSNGTVFELSPNSNKTAWTAKVLYSFCTQTSCDDGSMSVGATCCGGPPDQGVIMDASGNLYGTTPGGGKHSGGTVFELKP